MILLFVINTRVIIKKMKEKKTLRGAPKKPEKEKKTARVGVVQITPKKLEDYQEAAEKEKMKYSDWVRAALDDREKKANK